MLATSWLRFCDDREWFQNLFEHTGLGGVASAFHKDWEAPQQRGDTRLRAIERWLNRRYQGEPGVMLDDALSGTGLRGSRLDVAGCVVLSR